MAGYLGEIDITGKRVDVSAALAEVLDDNVIGRAAHINTQPIYTNTWTGRIFDHY